MECCEELWVMGMNTGCQMMGNQQLLGILKENGEQTAVIVVQSVHRSYLSFTVD